MKALLCLVVVLALASTSFASHFRYQTLFWERASSGSPTITVTLKQAWRWSAFGNPALNTQVPISSFTWGDGASSSITGTVVSINAADDWFFIQQTLTHTYPGLNNYTIQYSDCCRIGGLQDGNSGLSELIQTKVVLGSSALRSPQIASLPLIPFQINHDNSIQIPLIKDEQNNPVTFTITPTTQSALNTASPSLSNSNPSLPFALTSGGLMNWNPKNAGLYAFQTTATASNGNSVTLDVILKVSTAQADSTPPYWLAPTATSVHFTPGTLVTFQVSAKEDELDSISISAAALPIGATLSGCQNAPVDGRYNPCTGTFSWQTSATSTDTIVCFQANDAVGNYAPQNCVTLIADVAPVNNPCGGGNCAVKSVAASCSAPGSTVSHTGTGKCATLSFAGTSTQC